MDSGGLHMSLKKKEKNQWSVSDRKTNVLYYKVEKVGQQDALFGVSENLKLSVIAQKIYFLNTGRYLKILLNHMRTDYKTNVIWLSHFKRPPCPSDTKYV